MKEKIKEMIEEVTTEKGLDLIFDYVSEIISLEKQNQE